MTTEPGERPRTTPIAVARMAPTPVPARAQQAQGAAKSPAAQSPATSKYRRGETSVGAFLPDLTRKAFEKYGFASASIITDWPTIVGSELARVTAPEKLRWPRQVDAYGAVEEGDAGRPGALLILRVEPAFALDIQYRGAQIVERVNAYFGYRAVAELRIVQAALAPAKPDAGRASVPAVRPAVAQSAAVAARPDLDSVGNERLRTALAKLAANVEARRPAPRR